MGSTANNITENTPQAPAEDPDDSQDDGSDGEGWVLYRERKEWADVTPVPLDDGSHAVVKIAYTDACKCVDLVDCVGWSGVCVSGCNAYWWWFV